MTAFPVPESTASSLDWAQWYAAQSWPIFPCRGKLPMIPSAHPEGDPLRGKCRGECGHFGHGYLDATTDPGQIADWWQRYADANIGAATGQGWWALDVDPRNGGHFTLEALTQQHGVLPDTLLSHTGGGGFHYLWKRPASLVIHHNSIGAGLDVQASGGYIVLPPSLHPSGTLYTWNFANGPEDILPQPAPAWLETLVTSPNKPEASPRVTAGDIIPEGEREKTLLSMVGDLRNRGGTRDDIRAAFENINKRCQPPLSASDLDRMAESMERYPPNATLTVTARASHQNGSMHQEGPVFNFDAGISARELVKMMRVPPRFLVERLVPDGLTILAAPAKSYKSYFSLSLALATVGEGDWCDTFPVESQGNVVFFGLESPPMQLRNRMHQLRPGYKPDAGTHELIFFSGMHCLPPFKQGLQIAVEQIIERYTPRLIVIDPLSYLYRLGRQDDLASATLDLLWPLAEMAAKAQVAIFAPEHMRKRSKEDVSVVDQLAGSHIKAAVVHGLLMVHREGDDIIIETTMRDAPSQELALTLSFDEHQHRVAWGYKGANTTLGATRLDSMKTKALDELRMKRHPMKVSDLIVNCEFPNTDNTKNNLRQILHAAEKLGDVAMSKRGEYYWIGQP